MGCNAWNHPPDCNCGWGGVWYGSTGDRTKSAYYVPSTYYTLRGGESRYESYVNPNAICPVCGAVVFFYQSPYGSRVFFDELGPPWPKHPCTDNSLIPSNKLLRDAIDRKDKPEYPAWKKDGWEPFYFRQKWNGEPDCHHIEEWAIFQRRNNTDENLRCITFRTDNLAQLLKSVKFVFFKELPPRRGIFEVSIWTESGEVRSIGYANATLRATLEAFLNACAGSERDKFLVACFLHEQKLYEAAHYWLDELISEDHLGALRMKAHCIATGSCGLKNDQRLLDRLLRRADLIKK